MTDLTKHTAEDATAPLCLFAPYYEGNPYQDLLYREARKRGQAFEALRAQDVPGRLAGLPAPGQHVVFHQHWLREIFRGLEDGPEAREHVESYFDALREFQNRGGRVLWTVHNILDHDLPLQEIELNRLCLQRLARIADTVHVHARCSLAGIEEEAGVSVRGDVQLIQHPTYDDQLDHEPFLPLELRLRDMGDGIRFVTFGMQRPYKGSLDLLEAFLVLSDEGLLEGASLVIAGKIYDPELQACIEANRARLDRVCIIDRRLSDSELASLVRYADACVLPYRNINVSGSYYLAATFARACIVPELGMFRAEVENGRTGLKYDPGEGVVEGLLQAQAQGREALRRIGKEARAACAGFSQAEVSRRIADLLAAPGPAGDVAAEAGADAGAEPGARREAKSRAPGRDGVLLSFCIPVMNRLDDLRATLARNLEDNRDSAGRVEFVVVCFDDDDETERWVRTEFAAELDSGYLHFFRRPELEFWHFGRAKNAFRDLMRGRIYASLDGDNFTGPGGGEHIIEVFERFDYRCVFHQFQGEWGDGTCGRIALARDDYLDLGYDERFLPRQWDELDALLSVLVQRRGHRYVCYEGRSILDKSQPFRRFFEDHGWMPPTAELPPESDPLFAAVSEKAVGQHDNDYVQDDPTLRHSSVYNHLQSFFKNSDREDRVIEYVYELVEAQRRLVETVDPATLQQWVLDPLTPAPEALSQDDVVVLACLKDEQDLSAWFEHYRSLGASRFLLIDDGSATPVPDSLPREDVHVWRPLVGQFRYAKAFWLEILLSRYCEGLWCVTVDGDEYLSLPEFEITADSAGSDLRELTKIAGNAGQDYFGGFLLDLAPAADSGPEGMGRRDRYVAFQYATQAPDEAYREHNTARWSYGEFTDWAHGIDLRYRINGSLDSLRKFPVFRYQRGLHLNQGFHDLIIDGVKRTPADLGRPDLLPILHYKLWVMVQRAGEEQADYSSYHHETRANLARLQVGLRDKIASTADSGTTYEYLGYGLIPVPAVSEITLRLGGGKDSNDERLSRRAGFVCTTESDTVEMNGYELKGPDMEAIVEWLRSTTPFREIVRQDAHEVVLSAIARHERSRAASG